MSEKKYLNTIFEFILTYLMCFNLTYLFILYVGIDFEYQKIMIYIFFILIIYYIAFFNKLTLKISIILTLIICTILYNKNIINLQNTLVLVFIISILISIFIFLCTIKYKLHFIVLFIGALAYLYISSQNFTINNILVYMFIGLFILYVFINNYNKNKFDKENAINYDIFVSQITVISVAILFISIILSNLYTVKLDSIFAKKYYNSNIFSLSTAMFSSNPSELGGNIKLNKTPVFKIYSDNIDYTLYIKGNTRNIYTGTSWKNSDPTQYDFSNEREEVYLNIFEKEIGINLLIDDKKEFKDYFEIKNIKIEYKNIMTKSVFFPLDTFNIDIPFKKGEKAYIDVFENLYLEKTRTKNFKYSLDMYNFYKSDSDFRNLILNSKTNLYKENLYKDMLKFEKMNSLYERAEKIHEYYTQLPSELPKRVYDLAYDISKDEKYDYDKVKKIEQYLKNNYKYTLTPGKVAKNSDFVDYFLFQNKKGYCTYFATSMVVLVRSLGLPARYIEGYRVPKLEDNKTAQIITNESAHAWVEVYFEGFGWLTFEPTATFYNDKDNNSNNINPNAYDDYYNLYNQRIENNNIEYNNTQYKKATNYYIVILPILLLLILLFILYIIIKKHKKASNNELTKKIYIKYLKKIKRLGEENNNNDTLSVFAKRVDEKFDFSNPSFSDITEIFLKAKYSNLEISDEELDTMENMRIVKKTR